MHKVNQKIRRRLRRSAPHGLLSLRYFLPFQSDITHAHRLLWLAGRSGNISVVPWVLFEMWLWFRWCTFSGWRMVFLTLRQHGPPMRDATGLSMARQLWRLVRYSIGWCVSPSELYEMDLVMPGADPLGYVFDTEAAGVHNLHNKAHPGAAKSKALLRDKFEFAKAMRAKGIPTVETYHRYDRSATFRRLKDLFPEHSHSVFCKSRFGSRGRAAFSATKKQRDMSGRTLAGQQLLDEVMVEAAWRTLCAKGDAIVQPLLENHPMCAHLSPTGAIITVRVMTTRPECSIPENAQLEMPVVSGALDPTSGYVFKAIDMTTGKVDLPPSFDASTEGAENSQQNVPVAVPFWDEIYGHSKTMQDCELDLWSVAWDWVITPAGPVLLEGNSGFRLGALQEQHGGLVQFLATPSES